MKRSLRSTAGGGLLIMNDLVDEAGHEVLLLLDVEGELLCLRIERTWRLLLLALRRHCKADIGR